MNDATLRLGLNALDSGSKFIIEQLNNQGFEAYLVGGAVRDSILNRISASTDRDITTSAKPEDIKRIFKDYRLIETGIRYNTITIVVNGINYEVTTFRAESDYLDNRRPSVVSVAKTIENDLTRRDFTMNAIAFNAKTGFVDPFNGIDDINNRLINAVGNAEERFKEDSLRILRAMRFSAELGFKISENTKDAMLKCKKLVKNLSVERIFVEITKLLRGKYRVEVLREFHEILFEIIPELEPSFGFDQDNRSHAFDVFEHTLKALELENDFSDEVSWALLLHDSGKPHCGVRGADGYLHFVGHWEISSRIAVEVLSRLKAPKKFIFAVKTLCFYHDNKFNTKYDIKCFMQKYGKDMFEKILHMKFADLHAHSDFGINRFEPHYLQTVDYFNEIIKNNECYSIENLDFDGDDAVSLGFEGNQISELINNLLDLVMSEKIENKKNILLNYVIRKML